jgi:hypothetical protein
MEKNSSTNEWVFSGASISLCDAFPKWIKIKEKTEEPNENTNPLKNILDCVILKMTGDANFYMFDRLGPNMSGYSDENKKTVFNSWLVTNCSSDDDNDDNLSIINNQQAWSNTPRTIFLNDRPAAIIGLIFSLYPNSNFMQKLKCSGEIIFENNFVYTSPDLQQKINRLNEETIPFESTPSPLRRDSVEHTPVSNQNNFLGTPDNRSIPRSRNNRFGNPVVISVLPQKRSGEGTGGSKKKKNLKRKIGKSKKKLIQIKKNKTIKSKKKIIKKNFITIKFRKKRKY